MSILRKIPKIEQVLDNMSIESLKRLESLMNSGNGATETYTLFGGENKLNYTNKDLGVWYCNIELERNKSVETGFLIWESETKALFISYDITQCLKEYEIDLTTYTFVLINEKLSIEEFRRVLEDNINKEVVHIDTSGNVEIGKNLVVDGKVILNGKEDLVDTSGNELISGSSGGGDIWLDIAPYLNQNMTAISQEGFDLVSNAFFPAIETENPNNKYAGIIYVGYNCIFKGLIVGSKTGFNFNLNMDENGIKHSSIISIHDDKSVVMTIEGDNSNLTLPQTAPSSQVIPSITTSNEQQNLTIGDGLEIKNGALQATSSGGGAGNIKIFQPTINVQNFNYNDDSHSIEIIFNNNIFNEIKEYVNSLISANKSFSTQLLVKSEKYSNYQFIANGNGTFYDLAELPFSINLLYDTVPGSFQTVSLNVNSDNSSSLWIQTYEGLYSNFKTLAPMVFTNNTVIKVTVISYD